MKVANGDHVTMGNCNFHKYMSVAKCRNFDHATTEVLQCDKYEDWL